jgi:hypothetical protein
VAHGARQHVSGKANLPVKFVDGTAGRAGHKNVTSNPLPEDLPWNAIRRDFPFFRLNAGISSVLLRGFDLQDAS